MVSDNVNVRITGRLKAHLSQQISAEGLYENASEYIRDLIRRDVQDNEAAWQWLQEKLEPGVRAPDEAFVHVPAEDIIAASKHRHMKPNNSE